VQAVIRVQDVHKKFRVYYDKGQSLKEKVLFRNRNRYEEHWVLGGISFNVERGEAVGLVGENGCGKSTLLKLMTKIMYPDRGSISIEGRVSSLIELGAGFHPDMTGRENIYINASIFGLSAREVEERLEDIIAFSELGDFIDNPVRTYSSGMYMRLAFSVAINVDADVLLIDEILAVGDANFQAKCFEKLREIKASGTTIVIVSHALGSIESICNRSIWIADGHIREMGPPRHIHSLYLEAMGEKREQSKIREEKRQEEKKQAEKERTVKAASENSAPPEEVPPAAEEPPESAAQPAETGEDTRGLGNRRFGNRDVEFTGIELTNAQGERKLLFYTGEPFRIRMFYRRNKPAVRSNVGFGIFRTDGVHCYGTNTVIQNNQYLHMQPSGSISVDILQNTLMPGEYWINIAAYSEDNFPQDDVQEAVKISVISRETDVGLCKLNTVWQTDDLQIEH
jgi:ABC-type polysaccharide/polyol phosphate transport system ATPase subunit